jgi:hypothetical protein
VILEISILFFWPNNNNNVIDLTDKSGINTIYVYCLKFYLCVLLKCI